MNRMRLEFPAVSQNERFARGVISAFLLELDPTLSELSEVKTAVSEAVTNAVIHGYRDRSGTVVMESTIAGSVVTVTVTDRGRGIENIEQAMEALYSGSDDEERSGLGFTIMQSFMDEVEVTSEVGRGTVVTMRKKIGSAG